MILRERIHVDSAAAQIWMILSDPDSHESVESPLRA